MSIDPVTTDANTGGSFNRYNYANNNPYKYIDPDGRQTTIVEGTYDAMGNAQNLTAPDFKVQLYTGAVGVGLVTTTGVVAGVGPPVAAAIAAVPVAKIKAIAQIVMELKRLTGLPIPNLPKIAEINAKEVVAKITKGANAPKKLTPTAPPPPPPPPQPPTPIPVKN